MLRYHSDLAALSLIWSLIGCAPPVAPPPIAAKPVQLADGSTILPGGEPGLDIRSIELARVQIDIPRGREIGRMTRPFSGRGCDGIPLGPIHQERPRIQERSSEWNDTFFRVMSGHGFKVAGDPSQLFETQQRQEGDLQFGVIITEMQLDLIAICDFGDRPIGIRGAARLGLEWQVFDPARREVIFRQRNEGRFEAQQTIAVDANLPIQQAFADAVNRLAASPELRGMMTERALPRPPTVAATADSAPRMALRRLPPSQQAIDSQIDRLRNATVLIEAGASSHGSGFIVSEDGLMVTNRHVVGSQRFVRVKLLSGRAVIGEVLRRHDLRDVALVKLEGQGYPAMAIRETPVRVAEEAFVIGAPRDTELGWTVTRGVISAYRQAMPPERLDMIQSDVAIHGGNSGGPMLDRQGNVIGIAVAGMGMDAQKRNASLNLFIPILDGLDKLGLELLDAPEFERRRRVASGR